MGMKEFLTGFRAYWASYGFMSRHGLWNWLIPSVVLSFLIMVGGWLLIDLAADQAEGLFNGYFPPSEGLEEEASFWDQFRHITRSSGAWAIRALVYVALFWFKIKLIKYVVLVGLGPVMAGVSEAAENKLRGEFHSFSFKTWLREVVRGVRSAVLLFTLETTLGLTLWVAGAVICAGLPPLAFVIAPAVLVLTFLMSSWFYGASVTDFVWERQGLGARQGIRKSFSMPMRTLGLGLPFAIWMAIPFVNWYIAPVLAPVTSAVGAVLATSEATSEAISETGPVSTIQKAN
ncbi:unnamed protein product [marine sediment metagenome]|uniref:Uncharacterized protein n=1 Tax=marine sediment metagenome TaxID=412755 RepID=X1FIF9_9ZZZZ